MSTTIPAGSESPETTRREEPVGNPESEAVATEEDTDTRPDENIATRPKAPPKKTAADRER